MKPDNTFNRVQRQYSANLSIGSRTKLKIASGLARIAWAPITTYRQITGDAENTESSLMSATHRT